jgi:hypothetical protein
MNQFKRKLTILLLMIFVLSNSSWVIASVLKSTNYEVFEEETESEVEIQALVSKSSVATFKEIHGRLVSKILSPVSVGPYAVPYLSKVISKKYIMFRAILI